MTTLAKPNQTSPKDIQWLFEGFSPPPPSPSPPSPHPPSPSPSPPSPYYQLQERGFARLGRVKNMGAISPTALTLKMTRR